MKNKLRLKVIVFIVLFSLLNLQAFAADKKAKSIGKVITISGKVEVKKAGTKKFAAIKAGYAVFDGDTLRVGENAKATIAFQSGAVVTFPAASDTVLSDTKKPTKKSGSVVATIAKNIYNAIVDKFDSSDETEKVSMVAAIRGRKSSISLMYPRNEVITESNPVFKWNDSINGKTYRISIYGIGGLLWSATTDENEIVYPGTAPVFEKGKYYFWQVIVDGEPESEIAENAFFFILPNQQIAILKSGETEIKNITDSNPHDAVPYILLGTFYESFGIYSQALEQYDKALDLKPGDEGIKQMRDAVRKKQGLTN